MKGGISVSTYGITLTTTLSEEHDRPSDRLAAISKGPKAKTSVAPPRPPEFGSIPDLGHPPANSGD